MDLQEQSNKINNKELAQKYISQLDSLRQKQYQNDRKLKDQDQEIYRYQKYLDKTKGK